MRALITGGGGRPVSERADVVAAVGLAGGPAGAIEQVPPALC